MAKKKVTKKKIKPVAKPVVEEPEVIEAKDYVKPQMVLKQLEAEQIKKQDYDNPQVVFAVEHNQIEDIRCDCGFIRPAKGMCSNCGHWY
jgi:hypothetical protein